MAVNCHKEYVPELLISFELGKMNLRQKIFIFWEPTPVMLNRSTQIDIKVQAKSNACHLQGL